MVRPRLAYASIQLREPAKNAVDQHWAQGVVMSPNLVLVPDPPVAEDPTLVGAHLLHVPPAGGNEPRRLAIRWFELLSLDARVVCGAAVLSGQVGFSGRRDRPSDPRPLIESLRADGTIWPVLLGLAPPGSGPGSEPGTFLDGLPGGLPDPSILRPPRRTEFLDVDEIGKSICWWVPWCQPDGPV